MSSEPDLNTPVEDAVWRIFLRPLSYRRGLFAQIRAFALSQKFALQDSVIARAGLEPDLVHFQSARNILVDRQEGAEMIVQEICMDWLQELFETLEVSFEDFSEMLDDRRLHILSMNCSEGELTQSDYLTIFEQAFLAVLEKYNAI